MTSAAASLPLASPAAARKTLLLQTSVALLLSLAIGLYFWIDSRYPALLKKLHSGQAIHVSGVLSFDALMPVTPSMPVMTRIERTTVNWMWTNRIGMTFGICFGAALLTLLSTLPQIRLKSAAGNTALGAVVGVPLGVCANCVAPIGRGLFVAGASSNTVLATMISSPMLNVVVLAMAFTLFPLKIALVRLAVPLVLIAFVPVIVRQTAPSADSFASCSQTERWLQPVERDIEKLLQASGAAGGKYDSADDPCRYPGRCRCRIGAGSGRSGKSQCGGDYSGRSGGYVLACADGLRRGRGVYPHGARGSHALRRDALMHAGSVQHLPDADSGPHDFLAHCRHSVWNRYVTGNLRGRWHRTSAT